MDIPSIFGSMVFNDAAMRSRLPDDIYQKLRETILGGNPLTLNVANVIANAMMLWAVEKGATHYTHWFQPMTGITAEKHDSFISTAGGGKGIMEFSGKELVKGEPDASSLPTGGMRAAFEARGYTAWDPTSYAFVKEGTLYIPTAFCSYGGHALDKKTPLLRSMEALNTQALRVLKLFGDNAVKRVVPMVGAEQEYFLLDRDVYLKRPDLVNCGRTLFGARPPKGQELNDYYYGAIKPRVLTFMKDLEEELWRVGVYAKTRHNEAAPGMHELAVIYNTANVAADHNQLAMEMMQRVAARHNLACLLHEKPFSGISGSGKHNNWSLSTDTGINLLNPGDSPQGDKRFLLFLLAVVKAVDEYQDLLRLTVASAGNDHRLGEDEAPPAIISMYLGEELTGLLEAMEHGEKYRANGKVQMEIGVTALSRFNKDSTDRNRTSPFAFTGNKFEFRMPGAAFSISGPNFMLNTIVAESLRVFADRLQNVPYLDESLDKLIMETYLKHKRIIFNGNNYSREWEREATESRGLSNLKTTPEALGRFTEPSNVDVLVRHKVLTKEEVYSRYEILLAHYSKIMRIEALTMLDMARRDILPASIVYQNALAQAWNNKKSSPSFSVKTEEELLVKLGKLTEEVAGCVEELENAVEEAGLMTADSRHAACAEFMRETVFGCMTRMRKAADGIEMLTSRDYWLLPSYAEMLNSVY